ncbi:hypothetical protein CUC08_Gglean007462 [Alternaria sp. MG1]|nr:hypothetical protein B0T12DRAFT_272456 [Alternaria alternata]RII09062.1 hypothetical protein CUC08_Gglean007462 [Alternaria sp. MG1]RYN51018.1 hypothetical protein AA0118_g10712 [Alternaria tenuissima]RYO54605.1 hypothetical protein AA0116_g9346 [Alternaria tenuissima]
MDTASHAYEAFPTFDTYSAPTTPQHDHDAPIPTTSDITATTFEPFCLQYEGPLYTEINIPLPHIPAPPTTSSASPRLSTSAASCTSDTTTEKRRGRSRTLSSLSPFRHRSSSSASNPISSPTSPTLSPSRNSEEWPRIRRDIVKSREVNAMMNLRHQSKRGRSGTIDALAVVPAVLVLSAELFTPEEENGRGGREGRKDSGVGRWEDGIR